MDHDREHVWRSFLSVSIQLMERLDQELQQHHDIALVDYQILSMLDEAEASRLRMSDLASQVLVSRSRLTYRIDRLTESGFVHREECEDDRRGMWAIVTDSGRLRYHEAKTTYQAAVDAWFLRQMSEAELETCQRIMTNLSESLSATGMISIRP